MKTAGDILSTLFDEDFLKKAQGYSKLFNSWTDITAKHGIAAAAEHSRIKDVNKGVLLVEMDHPGWKQIIQTKQSELLDDFRSLFPEMNISEISLILSRGDFQINAKTENIEKPAAQTAAVEEQPEQEQPAAPVALSEPALEGYDAIKDEEFREKLIRLGQRIAAEEKHG